MAVQPGFAFDSASTGDQISWPAGDGGVAPLAPGSEVHSLDDVDWPGTDGGVSPPVQGGYEIKSEGGAIYRMRAFDSTLARIVFWNAPIVDTLGASYGGPGPLIDVVVHMLLGT